MDAYFSKHPFVIQLIAEGPEVTTRLRKDAKIRHLYHGPRQKRRGAPQKFDGYVDVRNLREDPFTPCAVDEKCVFQSYCLPSSLPKPLRWGGVIATIWFACPCTCGRAHLSPQNRKRVSTNKGTYPFSEK
jgi:hypothetical protein